MDTRFHCVYLLTSLDPRCQGQFYIGYTVNPLRRLRQHNGELVNGARRTSRSGRPWTLVCCVSGFPEDRVALKFEWSWQHPSSSARLKHTVPNDLAGLRRLPFAVGTLHYLLRSDLFSRLELRLHIFERDVFDEAVAVAVSHVEKSGLALARRGGPTHKVAKGPTAPPSRSQPEAEPLPEGDGAAPPTFPVLQPSHLFTIEVITREAFEDAYLAHDRCLARQLAEVSSLQELSVLSCPYDVSVLSQAVREQGDDPSLSQDRDASDESEGGEQWFAPGSTFDDDDDNELEAGRSAWLLDAESTVFSSSPSPQPEACRVGPATCEGRHMDTAAMGAQDVAAELPSTEAEGQAITAQQCTPPSHLSPQWPPSTPPPQRGASTPAKTRPWPNATDTSDATPPASRCQQEKPSEVPSSLERTVRRCASAPLATSTSPSPPSLMSSPLAAAGAGAGGTPTKRPVAGAVATSASVPWGRLPRRFRHFQEADFLREHAEEMAQLEAGLLPCTLCALPLQAPYVLRCTRAPFCALRCHLLCAALWAHAEVSPALSRPAATAPPSMALAAAPAVPPTPSLVPNHPFACPLCHVQLHWASLVKELKQRANTHHALQAQRRRLQTQSIWEARLAAMTATHQCQAATRRRGGRPAQPALVSARDREAPTAVPTVDASRKRVRSASPPQPPPLPFHAEAEIGLSLTQFDPSEW